MVSEGVDIPRLRVGVYATAAKTPLIFRQIVGRFVRTIPGRAPEQSWLYLPADPVLRDHAAKVEEELRHVLRRPSLEEEGLFDEPPDRRATEPAEADEFVPLMADVAPQMALFGGGPPPPRIHAPAPLPPGSAADADSAPDGADDRGLPAYERRALLRDKRHGLVSELRRRDGRTHAEINAWLNRACGITRVDDATLDQLERSIELLLGELTARR
jgi:hypothetical protein